MSNCTPGGLPVARRGSLKKMMADFDALPPKARTLLANAGVNIDPASARMVYDLFGLDDLRIRIRDVELTAAADSLSLMEGKIST